MHACNLSAGAQSLHSVKTVAAQRSLLILMHNEAIRKRLKKQPHPDLTTSIETPSSLARRKLKFKEE